MTSTETRAAKLLELIRRDCADHGACVLTNEELAARTGSSERTVRRDLLELQAKVGLVVKNAGKRGRQLIVQADADLRTRSLLREFCLITDEFNKRGQLNFMSLAALKTKLQVGHDTVKKLLDLAMEKNYVVRRSMPTGGGEVRTGLEVREFFYLDYGLPVPPFAKEVEKRHYWEVLFHQEAAEVARLQAEIARLKGAANREEAGPLEKHEPGFIELPKPEVRFAPSVLAERERRMKELEDRLALGKASGPVCAQGEEQAAELAAVTKERDSLKADAAMHQVELRHKLDEQEAKHKMVVKALLEDRAKVEMRATQAEIDRDRHGAQLADILANPDLKGHERAVLVETETKFANLNEGYQMLFARHLGLVEVLREDIEARKEEVLACIRERMPETVLHRWLESQEV